MKMKIMSLIMATAVLVSCSSTRYNSASHAAYNVPTVIATNFDAQYPTATNVVWTSYDPAVVIPIDWELTDWSVMESNDYVAQFDLGNDRFYSWFDTNGAWIGSTYAISDFNSLPAPVNTFLKGNFRDYSIETIQKEMWKDKTAFEIKLKNGDNKTKLLIDTNGNILKQKDKY